ncbi:MAG: hypothetical protein K9J30_10800 [Bacteroidales bacterium]|nr:hypothetical protein [Bacteroidales bacterium]
MYNKPCPAHSILSGTDYQQGKQRLGPLRKNMLVDFEELFIDDQLIRLAPDDILKKLK